MNNERDLFAAQFLLILVDLFDELKDLGVNLWHFSNLVLRELYPISVVKVESCSRFAALYCHLVEMQEMYRCILEH